MGSMERLVFYRELSEQTGIPIRSLRTLTYRGVIPHYKLGHRTVMFSPSAVAKALQKREVKAVGDR